MPCARGALVTLGKGGTNQILVLGRIHELLFDITHAGFHVESLTRALDHGPADTPTISLLQIQAL
jgi:hypothetical protein